MLTSCIQAHPLPAVLKVQKSINAQTKVELKLKIHPLTLARIAQLVRHETVITFPFLMKIQFFCQLFGYVCISRDSMIDNVSTDS